MLCNGSSLARGWKRLFHRSLCCHKLPAALLSDDWNYRLGSEEVMQTDGTEWGLELVIFRFFALLGFPLKGRLFSSQRLPLLASWPRECSITISVYGWHERIPLSKWRAVGGPHIDRCSQISFCRFEISLPGELYTTCSDRVILNIHSFYPLL